MTVARGRCYQGVDVRALGTSILSLCPIPTFMSSKAILSSVPLASTNRTLSIDVNRPAKIALVPVPLSAPKSTKTRPEETAVQRYRSNHDART